MDSLLLSNTDIKRFEKKFTKDLFGCWEWKAACGGKGYGYFSIKRKVRLAHRVSWTIYRGSIPDGLHIDHKCRNKACVNPDHLDPVSQAENNHRVLLRGYHGSLVKTHCPRDHPYDETNTRWYQGRRFCRACAREQSKRWHNANRETVNARHREKYYPMRKDAVNARKREARAYTGHLR